MLGMFDVLSQGCMIFGIGSGYVRVEFEVLGFDFAAWVWVHDEYLCIIIVVLLVEEVFFEGEFYWFGLVCMFICLV